jgi:hypothetical protein
MKNTLTLSELNDANRLVQLILKTMMCESTLSTICVENVLKLTIKLEIMTTLEKLIFHQLCEHAVVSYRTPETE